MVFMFIQQIHQVKDGFQGKRDSKSSSTTFLSIAIFHIDVNQIIDHLPKMEEGDTQYKTSGHILTE